MDNFFRNIIGNNSLLRLLSAPLSHAYIIEGAPGSGRFTLAKFAAAATLCQDTDEDGYPCGVCDVCSRIIRDIHPDVSVYTRGDKKSIGVDVIRSLREQVFIAPNESERRFFIIKDAELMTPEAQNALLISIEEPPPYSVFFLLTKDRTQLLETVRSRCTPLQTERIDDSILREHILSLPEGKRVQKTDPDALARAVSSAEGSIGRARELLLQQSKKEDEAAELARRLIQVSLTGTSPERIGLAGELPKGRDTLESVLTYAIFGVRDIIAKKLRSDAAYLLYGKTGPDTSLCAMTLPKLTALASLIDDSLTAVSGNASSLMIWERIVMHRI